MIKHIISSSQFNKEEIKEIFEKAEIYQNDIQSYSDQPLRGRILSCLFYEPSTRTRSSFTAAMNKLGGNVIPITQSSSSIIKGESLEDTIKVISQYSDAIALRHTDIGASDIAASVSNIPIINAGDGAGEHPTQSLLDLYTINKELGHIDKSSITFMGDLKNGRTVHSLIKLISNYDVKINLISSKDLSLDSNLTGHVTKNQGKILFIEDSNVEDIIKLISSTDILYMTRVQKERFESIESYNAVKDKCAITQEILNAMKEKSIIMHPLPRVNELPSFVDKDHRAVYFKQVNNGLYIRMSILSRIIC